MSVENCRVYIKGKDFFPCSSLLDALTDAHLLDPQATWEQQGDMIILTVPSNMAKHFIKQRFTVAQDKQETN